MRRALQNVLSAARSILGAGASATWRKALAPAAIVAVGLLAFAVLVGGDAEPPPVGATERTWSVQVMAARPGPRAPTLELFGSLESPRHAQLSAQVQADVAEVPVNEGDLVEAGAVVVVLDEREARLALQQSEAEVENVRAQLALEIERNREDLALLDQERILVGLARTAVDRGSDLETRDLISQSDYDDIRERAARQELSLVTRESAVRAHASRRSQMEAQLRNAEAARDRAALDLRRTRPVAPFRARVVEVLVAQGEQVQPGAPLVSLFDVSRVEVRAQIPSRHLAMVTSSQGQRGWFKLGGERYEVTLDRLGGQMQQGRGGVDALFVVDGSGDDLRIGRTVNLTLELEEQPGAVWLPFEALYGQDRIFAVRDERLAGIEVLRIGEGRGPQGQLGILVTSPDLASGDRILVSQLANAVNGLRVAPVPAAADRDSRAERR